MMVLVELLPASRLLANLNRSAELSTVPSSLKSNLTDQINDSGQMDMSALMNIKDLYFDGDMEAAPALSGQSIGLINEVKSVKQIVNEIINEFNNTCESLGNIRF